MTEESKGITAIFPVIQNPPTFGFLMSLYSIADNFEKIYIVLQNKPYIFSAEVAKKHLEAVLCKYSTKFVVIISNTDFSEDTTFDENIPPYDYILTTSIKVYSNLLSKGHSNTRIISSLKGWNETMHRIAYLRSTIYDELKAKLINFKQ